MKIKLVAQACLVIATGGAAALIWSLPWLGPVAIALLALVVMLVLWLIAQLYIVTAKLNTRLDELQDRFQPVQKADPPAQTHTGYRPQRIRPKNQTQMN